MIKDKLSLLKGFINKKNEGKESKKTIENLLIIGIILVIAVIFINYMFGDNKSSKNEASTNKVLASTTNNSTQNTSTTENELETKLKNILTKINGVGNVDVMVTYSQSSKTIPLYNEDIQATTTEEKDTSGGTRKITENTSNREVVYNERNGQKSVITQSIVSPEIEGAIVIADGASNASVKNNIIQAVEAVTGLSTHKIQVFEMK